MPIIHNVVCSRNVWELVSALNYINIIEPHCEKLPSKNNNNKLKVFPLRGTSDMEHTSTVIAHIHTQRTHKQETKQKVSISCHFGLPKIYLNTCRSVWLGSIPHFQNHFLHL